MSLLVPGKHAPVRRRRPQHLAPPPGRSGAGGRDSEGERDGRSLHIALNTIIAPVPRRARQRRSSQASVDWEYVPETCPDPDFDGLAVGCTELCEVHQLEPKKCVAFEGTNTGRRFYTCSVQNIVENCGFVQWVDEEWPPTCKRALGKLWGMYEDALTARVDDRISNASLMKELSDEKNKWEQKYHNCVAEVNKFIKDTSKSCMKANYEKIQKEGRDNDMMQQMKITINLLETQVSELKNVQRSQAEEKKKLEYNLYDLLKINDENKEKLKRIKAIFEQ